MQALRIQTGLANVSATRFCPALPKQPLPLSRSALVRATSNQQQTASSSEAGPSTSSSSVSVCEMMGLF